MHHTTRRLLMLTLACLPVVCAAQARPTPPSPDAAMSLPPHLRAQLLEAQRAAQRAPSALANSSNARARQAAGNIDTTPPTLTGLRAITPTVDARVRGEQAVFHLTARDEAVGVDAVYVGMRGPSGQVVWGAIESNPSSHRVWSEALSWQPPATAEPGRWEVERVYVSDLNGNAQVYSSAELAAMGMATEVTVSNTGAVDSSAPMFLSGTLDKSIHDLASKQPGTGDTVPAPITATIRAQDVGNAAISGIRVAVLELCTADESSCFDLISPTWDVRVPGGGPQMLKLAALSSDFSPIRAGQYFIRSFWITDFSGNQSLWEGSAFGGSTDFSSMFARSSITVMSAAAAPGTRPAQRAEANAVDATPPVLHRLRRSGQELDLSNAASQVLIGFNAADERSGVSEFTVCIRDPNGQRFWLLARNYAMPSKWEAAVSFPERRAGAAARWRPTGIYTIESVNLRDGNRNQTYLDETQLNAVGLNTKINVRGNPVDASPPTFIGARVLTPTVSMSARVAGATASIWPGARVQMAAKERSSKDSSGVTRMRAHFIMRDPNWPYPAPALSAVVVETQTNVAGRQRWSSVAGTRAGWIEPAVAGRHELCSVDVQDLAGNTTSLSSPVCGGTTDFSKLFNQTFIEVTP